MANDSKNKRHYTPRKLTTKICKHCGKSYETRSYNSKFCCSSCLYADRYLRQRDKRIEMSHRRWREHGDVLREQERKRYWAHREENLALNKARYQKNKAKMVVKALEYQRDHPEVVLATRARRVGVKIYRVTKKDLDRLVSRYDGRCAYCGVKLTDRGYTQRNCLQWDHVIPVSRGGENGIGNLLPVCSQCNWSKRSSLLSEYRMRRLKEEA